MSNRTQLVHALFATALLTLDATSAIGQVPMQFVTNGKAIGSWTTFKEMTFDAPDGKTYKGVRVAYRFARATAQDHFWHQFVMFEPIDAPNEVYHFNVTSRRFEGRWDREQEAYSWLKPEHRKRKSTELDEGWFPAPSADIPTIYAMIRSQTDPKEITGSVPLEAPPASDSTSTDIDNLSINVNDFVDRISGESLRNCKPNPTATYPETCVVVPTCVCSPHKQKHFKLFGRR